MEELRLFSYKMTHDTGFAPNPFFGLLTLANCKPQIRKSKKINDWIAGFTSNQLNGDKTGDERLVYLMKVTEKVDYAEYWNNPRYANKIPVLDTNSIEDKAGDNIYKPLGANKFEQIENKNHDESSMMHDLNGEFVLISSEFYYFGGAAIYLPGDVKPKLPKGQSGQGVRTYDIDRIKSFLDYMKQNYKMGMLDFPHQWPKKQ